jgi:hypothetical protein
VLGACSCRKDTENASASTDIEDDLVLEVLGVALNRISVGVGTDLVLQHLLVDVEVGVAAEVVVVLLVVVLQVLSQLLFELDIVKPGLGLASEASLGGWEVRLNLLLGSLGARSVIVVATLLLLLVLDGLVNWSLLLNLLRAFNRGRLLHLDVGGLSRFFFNVLLATSLASSAVAAVLETTFLIVLLRIVVANLINISARLYLLEIFHVVYMLLTLLFIY